MDINTMRGILTAILFIAFIGLVIWVYSKKRVAHFDEAANLPFVDDPVAEKLETGRSAKNTNKGEDNE